jgi:dolichol-phosphate mannosyltransferase
MIIAVISPTYNEQDNVSELIEKLLDQQNSLQPGDILHVVISDSHSSDKTGEIVSIIAQTNPRVHYLDVKERGIGVGIIKGFNYAISDLKADILISLDADLSHPPEAIPVMVQKIREGYNWVIGSRFVKGGRNDLQLHRRLFSFVGNTYARFMMGIYSLHEFTASYRALTREMYQKLDLNNIPWQSKSFVIQPSIAYELANKGAKFTEVPIVFTDRRAGNSKMKTFLYIKELSLFAFNVRVKKQKQFIKFLVVGGTGFIINTIGLILFHKFFNIDEAIAASMGAEIAIISNFFLNNQWTFKHKKIEKGNRLLKLLQFNLSSLGAIVIQFVVVYLGTTYITPTLLLDPFWEKEVYLVYYIFAVGLGLIYNYLMYSRVIWKKDKPTLVSIEQRV